jgi:hypothetical protein
MTSRNTPSRLRRHLGVVLAVKALALAGLWLLVVRDGRVPVDAAAMAANAGLASSAAHQSIQENRP